MWHEIRTFFEKREITNHTDRKIVACRIRLKLPLEKKKDKKSQLTRNPVLHSNGPDIGTEGHCMDVVYHLRPLRM